MIRLLQFLIHGCFHKYTVHDICTYGDEYGSYWQKFILRCEKCGKMISFKP